MPSLADTLACGEVAETSVRANSLTAVHCRKSAKRGNNLRREQLVIRTTPAKLRIVLIAVSGSTTWRSPLVRKSSRSFRCGAKGCRPAADSHTDAAYRDRSFNLNGNCGS
jgi:hypothetical protein